MAQPKDDAALTHGRRQPVTPGPLAWVGHRAREALVHLQRVSVRWSPVDRRVVFFPCSTRAVGSSHLRVYELARGLERLGWRAIVVPPQLEVRQRQRILDAEHPAIVVIQKGRSAYNWPDLYRTDAALVFDLDDADYSDPGQARQCEACCRAARAVLAGSRNVASWCRRFNDRVEVVWTGHPIPRLAPMVDASARRPIVAWAQSSSMKYPAEAALVRDAVMALRARPGLEFWLYGLAHEGEGDAFLAPLRARGIATRAFTHLPPATYVRTLHDVSVGLHPSVISSAFSQGKSFGKVLAYLSAGVPVIASDVNENPAFFEPGATGLLCPPDPSAWAAAIDALLDDPALRGQMARDAFVQFVARLSIPAIACQVDAIFRGLVDASGNARGESLNVELQTA